MDTWKLVYDRWDPEQESLRESLCALGNGHFVTRGAAEESTADEFHYPGTYIAGGYNRLTTHIAGHDLENEDLVNWPNWLPLTFRMDDGDWFDLRNVEVIRYRQELDLQRGLLEREIRFRTSDQRETELNARRLVHMRHAHYAAIAWQLTPINWSGSIEIRTGIDASVTNAGVARYRALESRHLEVLDTERYAEDRVDCLVRTRQSRVEVAQAARTMVWSGEQLLEPEWKAVGEGGFVGLAATVKVEQDQPLHVEKTVALHTSRDNAIAEARHEVRRAVERAGTFPDLLASHARAWEELWRRCDIELVDQEETQLVLRLHIFHLLQSLSPHSLERDVGVPSRGWHGEAYRGHVFWDELFILPFLRFRLPELARDLLLYRYRRLEQARRNAREAGLAGALYPWQSGSDGREESQQLHLNPKSGRWIPDNSWLQKHVNAAIAYNVWQYVEVTDDREFLATYGAEMILEIARLWASLATYNDDHQRYEILRVMGPDEYHDALPDAEQPGLDNNTYTSVMAAWTLDCAEQVLEMVQEERRDELLADLDITEQELERWRDITHNLRIVFHEDGIISQFEGYEQLEELDWEAYHRRYGEVLRLDRILEAEGDTPNRYKTAKQADVLMLFYLFSTEELQRLFEQMGYSFDAEAIPRNIDYYLRRTSHGSTLSLVVHSWVLARSQREESCEHFKNALESDISDIQGGTTSEGIHLGAMAGTVDIVQRCYTGTEVRDGVLWFNPALPGRFSRAQMRIRYRGQWIDVFVSQDRLRLTGTLERAKPVKVGFAGRMYDLRPGEKLEFELNK